MSSIPVAHDVLISLDQGGRRSETPDRVLVQRPDGLGYRGAMTVDEQPRARRVDVLGKPGQINLTDRCERQGVDVGGGIATVVDGAHKDIVDIQ